MRYVQYVFGFIILQIIRRARQNHLMEEYINKQLPLGQVLDDTTQALQV